MSEVLNPAASSEPALPRMTYEEFLAWADEETHAEWVDGEVIPMSPITTAHQDLLRLLIQTVDLYVRDRGCGTVRFAPSQMNLASRPSGREPDLMFISTPHLSRVTDTYVDGPADLVVEIVNPESAGRDRGDKYYEYEAAGVREYWILDPQRKQAEFYQLGADGIYLPVLPVDGTYSSREIEGLWVNTEWLFRDPLPHPREIWKAWGLD